MKFVSRVSKDFRRKVSVTNKTETMVSIIIFTVVSRRPLKRVHKKTDAIPAKREEQNPKSSFFPMSNESINKMSAHTRTEKEHKKTNRNTKNSEKNFRNDFSNRAFIKAVSGMEVQLSVSAVAAVRMSSVFSSAVIRVGDSYGAVRFILLFELSKHFPL